MFGKNNFDEKLRRMEMQAKKDRFSIRKLAIGAASVLLGFSFMGVASQTAKADTLAAGQQETVVANKQENAKDVANKPELSTFSGLSAFLRGGSEEESSASESSTASQASGASSASSSSASEASSSSQASEGSQSSNASQASTGSTASQASQASSSGSEASAASTGSVSSDGAQKIKTTHANDIVIHHLLVDAYGNKTTTPVKGLGDEKGDTYIDGYIGDTKTISATDPEQVAPDGYKIVADQKSVTWTFVKDQNKEIIFYYQIVPTVQENPGISTRDDYTPATDFTWQYNSDNTAYMKKFNGSEQYVNIPPTIVNPSNGQTYTVTRIDGNYGGQGDGTSTSESPATPNGLINNSQIKSLTIPGTIKTLYCGTIGTLPNLESFTWEEGGTTISQSIQDLGPGVGNSANDYFWEVFWNTPKLVRLYLPSTLVNKVDPNRSRPDQISTLIGHSTSPLARFNNIDYVMNNFAHIYSDDGGQTETPLSAYRDINYYIPDANNNLQDPDIVQYTTSKGYRLPTSISNVQGATYDATAKNFKLNPGVTSISYDTTIDMSSLNKPNKVLNITLVIFRGSIGAKDATLNVGDSFSLANNYAGGTTADGNTMYWDNSGVSATITDSSGNIVQPSQVTQHSGTYNIKYTYTYGFDADTIQSNQATITVNQTNNITVSLIDAKTGTLITSIQPTVPNLVTGTSLDLSANSTILQSAIPQDYHYALPNELSNGQVQPGNPVYGVSPQNINVYISKVTQKAPINVHAVTIPGDSTAVVQVPQFADQTRWGEFLNTTNNVMGVAWSNPADVNMANGPLDPASASHKANIAVKLKDNSIQTINADLNVVGATDAGITTGFNSNSDRSKDVDDADAKAAVNSSAIADFDVTKYTWAADANDSQSVDTTWSSNSEQPHDAYVIVHYKDGTKQAVKVQVKIISQKDQNAASGHVVGQKQNKNIGMHVNETEAGQDGVDALQKDHWNDYFDNTDNVASIKWHNRPTVSSATEDGAPDTTGSLDVTFNDGSTTTITGVRVDVAGAEADDNAKADSEIPLNNDAGSYLSETSKDKIKGFNPTYSYADKDGNPVSTPKLNYHDGEKQTIYVKVTYHDNSSKETGSQLVSVPVAVTSQADKYKLTGNTITVHAKDDVLSGTVGKPADVLGATDGKGNAVNAGSIVNEVDWNPGQTLNTVGSSTATGTAHYNDGTSTQVTFPVNVIGAVAKPSNTVSNKPLDNDPSKYLDTSSLNGSKEQPSYTYVDANGKETTTPPTLTYTDENKGKEDVVIHVNYSDGSKQTIKVPFTIAKQSDSYSLTGKTIIIHVSDTAQNGKIEPVNDVVSVSEGTAAVNSADTVIDHVDWNANQIFNRIGDGQSATGTATFKDTTTKSFAFKVNVVGAKADPNATVDSKVQLTGDGSQYLDSDSKTAIGNYNPTYKYTDKDGNAVAAPTLSAADGKTGQKIYVTVTYHKDSTSGTETGKQTVEVPVTVIDQSSQAINNVSQAHAMTMHVGENDTSQDSYLDNAQWGSYFNNTSNVKSMAWATRPTVTSATATDTPDTTGSVTITFNDNSAKTLTGIKVDVVGAKADSNATVDSKVQLTGDGSQYLDSDSKTAIGNYNPTYKYTDKDGNAVAAPTLSAADGKTGQKIYVTVTYHKDSTSGTETGKQTVEVPVTVIDQSSQAINNVSQVHDMIMHVGENDTSQDSYLDNTQWGSYFNNTSNVKSMAWVARPKVSDITATNTPDTTGSVTITFNDNSAKTLTGIKVDVVGAKADSNATVDSKVQLTGDGSQYLDNSSKTAIGNYNPTYKYTDKDGNAVAAPTLSAADGKTGQKIYVTVTYHKDSTSGTETGKQTVEVPVTVIDQSSQAINNVSQVHDMIMHVGENDTSQDSYLDNTQWGSYFNNTSNVKSMAWVARPKVSDITATNTPDTTGSITITFNDNSTKTLTGIKVGVVGASHKDGSELNSEEPVPTDSDSLGNYLNTGTISDWSPTYSLVKADGTPATSPYYNTTWTSGSHESEDIYVKVMYHKPGSGMTGAEDGFQIVKVTIGLRQPPTPVTPVVITPKGGMVFVKRGQRLTAIEAQRAISNHEELDKANANYSWVTPLPNTQMLGSKIGHVRVFYKGQTTIVMVTVMVTN
ncbi:YSIRK-type signal peptide-containing protein [Lactobacillus sp. ESL0791]|uniref:Rib/alpha-like domain-containing protein n=1 Tax=Lactobacillus sp. ESL0791 TaxID=2983234 RepID=UPI0023F64544|nr:YSIRK-type signal peptide-containing protein [Lactobacillus sp. ESL0791]MDF7639205.1 YSIRK-type signal peptide-containing protein [Lactobacillus sp. ESL0791]